MLRVDGFYLYKVGSQLHPLTELKTRNVTYRELQFPLYLAEAVLEPLITNSVFRLRMSVDSGQTLLGEIRSLSATIRENNDNLDVVANWISVYDLKEAVKNFETVLGAELSLSPLYVVMQKAAFDMPLLIEAGIASFPQDLQIKVPDAVPDINHGTRCIAFELFTASGFHLHRANEAVLRVYWDAVTSCAPRPKNRNMGDYLAELVKMGKGDSKTITALRDLKDMHRNPLIHPEHSIDSADEAIALMNGIHNAVVQMLREIPGPSAPPVGGVGPP